MKRKLAFLLLVVAAAGSGMSAMDTEKVISLLKRGAIQKKSIEIYDNRSFGFGQIMASGFASEDVFVFSVDSSFALNKNFNKWTQGVEGSFEVNHKKDREGLSCKPVYGSLQNPVSLKDTFNTMTSQQLEKGNMFTGTSVVATRTYCQKKFEDTSKKDLFFYFNPDQGSDTTPLMLCKEKGLLCGILAPLPGDTCKDDEVMNYVQKNTRVCIFKIVDAKLELVRDMGRYPYCKGVYMNPTFNCMAILYGNGKDVKSELSMVQFTSTNMFHRPSCAFTDVIIN